MTADAPRSAPWWAWAALVVMLVFAGWWRGHTFGPTVLERSGVRLWPVVSGETEPLDCDEAAYGYIGRRLNEGAVLYRDLTENKPPAGYWLYALAERLGGADELTIRVMPVPIVLATIAMVWWLGLRLAGPLAGCASAFLFTILSTDPYVFGNGANLEHAINLFRVASLAAMVRAGSGTRSRRACLVVAGAMVGMACLVKQVAIVDAPLFAAAVWFHREGGARRSARARLVDVLALGGGFALVWSLALGVLVGQGAGHVAFEDIVLYGSALATDTPTAKNAPHMLIRWLTGNSDPRDGSLPWPFGATDWLTWWGAGSWPIWLASAPGLAWLLVGRGTSGGRRLAGAWTLSAWVQVVLPGLYWPHYYLLPTPGAVIAVGVLLADAARGLRQGRGACALALLLIVGAMVGGVVIQVRDYLLVPPTHLTIRYKGGFQWVRLRGIGRELGRRRTSKNSELYVWGWQSPLYFYSGMDSPSRHFFANELLKAKAGSASGSPMVRGWVEEILHDLRARPPEVIFLGDRPFPALREFVETRYVRSLLVPEAPALWIRLDAARAFRVEPPG